MDPILARHDLVVVVSNLLATLGRAELLKLREALEPEQKAGLDRAKIFARQVKEGLESLSAADLSVNLLSGVHSGLLHANNEFNSYISSGNSGHVNNALGNLDSAIASASQAFFKRSIKGSRVYEESLNAVQNTAQTIIKELDSAAAQLSAKVNDVQDVVNSQADQNDILREDLKKAVERIQADANAFKQQLGDLEGGLNERYDALNEGLAAKYEQAIREKEEELGKYIERLNIIEAEAKRILQLIGKDGVTGNYKNRADSEAGSADVWRWIALGFFALGVSLAVFSLYKNIAGSIDVTTLLLRFTMAITIAIPAFYAARESARHRSNADRARQTELELASLGPFLETLPEDERIKLISALTPEYFGKLVADHKIEALMTPADVAEIISKAIPGRTG